MGPSLLASPRVAAPPALRMPPEPLASPPSMLPPAGPPAPAPDFPWLGECTGPLGLTCAQWGLVAALIVLSVVLECYCYRKRGIGFFAILALIPRRCGFYGSGLLNARDSETSHLQRRTFVLLKWRPWRRRPTGENWGW